MLSAGLSVRWEVSHKRRGGFNPATSPYFGIDES
jgi:hypothetical protein